MMWGWYAGNAGWWMWIVGPLMMLLFWGAIIWLFVTLVRGGRRPEPPRYESATEIARRRFAAGEITEAEFDRLIARLSPASTDERAHGSQEGASRARRAQA